MTKRRIDTLLDKVEAIKPENWRHSTISSNDVDLPSVDVYSARLGDLTLSLRSLISATLYFTRGSEEILQISSNNQRVNDLSTNLYQYHNRLEEESEEQRRKETEQEKQVKKRRGSYDGDVSDALRNLN